MQQAGRRRLHERNYPVCTSGGTRYMDEKRINIRIDDLRKRLLAELESMGYKTVEGRLTLPVNHKAALRDLHAPAVAHNRAKARKGLERHEDRLLGHLASGQKLVPDQIRPVLMEVKPRTEEELLFRYARLHWSIPVSAGYGRRLRFIIKDETNGKLIGIIGLSDPVFALGVRDTWIGWTQKQRKQRLANVMDAFVLGAVPPYSMLLCGKLVALATASLEVQEAFSRRYATRPTRIAGKMAGPLALITTTSALGRSSVYNRLSYEGKAVFQSVGYTRGSGEFQFLNGLYRELRELVEIRHEPTAKHEKWGKGFRNRREVMLRALSTLGLSRDLIYHGVSREVFVVPLAFNTASYLRGETTRLIRYHRPFGSLADYFMERWLLPRALRDTRYRDFEPESWRLWETR